MGWKKKVERALKSWTVEPAPRARSPADGARSAEVARPGDATVVGLLRRLAEVERALERRAHEGEASGRKLETALHAALHQHGCRIAEIESAISARQVALDARLEAVSVEVGRATEEVDVHASQIEATILAAERGAVERITALWSAQTDELERVRTMVDSLIADIAPERVRSASRLSDLETLLRSAEDRLAELARDLGTYQDRLVRQAAAHETTRRSVRRAGRLALVAIVLALAAVVLGLGLISL